MVRIILLVLLLIPLVCFGWGTFSMQSDSVAVVGGDESYVLKDNIVPTVDFNAAFTSSRWWHSFSWITTSTYNLRRVTVLLYSTDGVLTGRTFSAYIYNVDGNGKPTTLVTDASTTFSGNTISIDTEGVEFDIDFSSDVALSDATEYALVFNDATDPTTGPYLRVRYEIGDGTESVYRGATLGELSQYNLASTFYIKTYSYE